MLRPIGELRIKVTTLIAKLPLLSTELRVASIETRPQVESDLDQVTEEADSLRKEVFIVFMSIKISCVF